jgi:hypothetical protein
MKINKKDLTKLIRESIKDKISKLREKSENNKIDQAKLIIAILSDEANALNSLAKHAREQHMETGYSELEKEANSLEMVRDQKLSRIQKIKTQFGIVDKPKKVRVPKELPKK